MTVVLDGKATPTKKKSVTELVEKVVTISKGKVGKVEDLGTKDLAYPLHGNSKIGKSATGVYLYFPLELEARSAKDVTAKLRTNEDIIRYLLIVKD